MILEKLFITNNVWTQEISTIQCLVFRLNSYTYTIFISCNSTHNLKLRKRTKRSLVVAQEIFENIFRRVFLTARGPDSTFAERCCPAERIASRLTLTAGHSAQPSPLIYISPYLSLRSPAQCLAATVRIVEVKLSTYHTASPRHYSRHFQLLSSLQHGVHAPRLRQLLATRLVR